MMTRLGELRGELLTDPEVRAEYERLGPIFAVVGEMIEARHAAGLTQAEVASRMGTMQSVVARLENGRTCRGLRWWRAMRRRLGGGLRFSWWRRVVGMRSRPMADGVS